MAVQWVDTNGDVYPALVNAETGAPINDWEILSRAFGAQKAPYMAGNLGSNPEKNRITCQDCGKSCTPNRGGFVLTRSTIVCGRCYRPEIHGDQSSVSNYGPTQDPATCQHGRTDGHQKKIKGQWPPVKVKYCLDCWAVLKTTGGH